MSLYQESAGYLAAQNDLKIAHFDCDCFFAAVEKRDAPELNSKPIIVGGDGARSVVAAACYLARLYGIKSAMPVMQAKKRCPDLVIIPHDFEKYRKAQKQIKAILSKPNLPLKYDMLDEGYLDLRDYHGDKIELCRHLQNLIRRELKLSLSFGLGSNKIMAKIICNIDKPNGLSAMGTDEMLDWLKDKPVTILPGVGFATAQKLKKIGITRISQLQNEDILKLTKHLGKFGVALKKMSLAEGEVNHLEGRTRKVRSTECTFEKDLPIDASLYHYLKNMSLNLGQGLKEHNQACHTVCLKLRRSNFTILNRHITLNEPIGKSEEIFEAGAHLLTKVSKQEQLTYYRLIGIGVTNFVANKGTGNLFAPH